MAEKRGNENNYNIVLKRLNKNKIKDTHNKITFSAPEFSENVSVLNSMISLNKSIPEIIKRQLIRKAVFNVAETGEITAENLLHEIDALEQHYLRKKPKKFCLITTLSINPDVKIKRRAINGCVISFSSGLPNRFSKEIEKIRKHASSSIFGVFPANYVNVKVSVSEKSPEAAAEKALDALDIIRAIWNLFYNRVKVARVSGGERNPVNEIVTGPLHTIHFPNGMLATESWWYESSYRGPLKTSRLKNLANLYKFHDNARELLRKSNFYEFLVTSLIRYVRSLDLRDWETSFLRQWSLLEYLTSTNSSESHQITVKRASFLYGDRKYVEQLLNYLRNIRNRAVHVEGESHDIEALMYQIKMFVEKILQFQIANAFKFGSLQETREFLDLTDDTGQLHRRIELMKKAVKFLG